MLASMLIHIFHVFSSLPGPLSRDYYNSPTYIIIIIIKYLHAFQSVLKSMASSGTTVT